MTSEAFYAKFMNGEFDNHNDDYFQWSGEYEVLLDFQNELKCIS